MIYYNWVAFTPAHWGPYLDTAGYRLYQVEMPSLTNGVLATGVVLSYLAYATTAGADTTSYYVSPEPGNFINYSISREFTQTMSVVMQPGAIYFYIADLGYNADPGTLSTLRFFYPSNVSAGWYYRIIIIPGGVLGNSARLSYKEICARYGIKP